MNLIEHIKAEWPVIKQAPWTFGVVAVLGVSLAVTVGIALFGAAADYYEGQAEMWEQRALAAEASGSVAASMAPLVPVGESADTSNAQQTYPTAQIVAIQAQVVNGLPVVEDGKEILLNVGVNNRGPGLARKVRWTSSSFLMSKESSAQEAALISKAFDGMNAMQPPNDLPLEGVSYSTMAVRIPPELIGDVSSGELRIYVLHKMAWEDSTGVHTGRACHWLQGAATSDPKQVAWHYCASHNSTD